MHLKNHNVKINRRVKMRSCWVECVFVIVVATLTLVQAQDDSLSGHSVIRVTPQTGGQLRHIKHLLEKFKSVDVWRYPSTVNSSVDIRVSPWIRDDVIGGFEEAGLPVTTLIEDVQAVIDDQAADRQAAASRHRGREFEYFHYHTLDEIYAWMKNITTFYKDKAVLFNVTESYEGRPLMGIHIASQPQKRLKRPVFFFEGGIHAREWISPATVIYMVGKMLDLYGLDPELTATVDKFEWYILPVTNPDGYVYTWEGNQTRLWRKTRSKQDKGCIGVDPNRNWDVQWCEKGASKDPCQDTYCGPSAFSEVEVKGVADFIMKLENVKAFIDFHSYSQLWMTPYAYTKELPKDFKVQDQGSIEAVKALTRLYETEYKHGSLSNTINYISSWRSADLINTKANNLFSNVIEKYKKNVIYNFILLFPSISSGSSADSILRYPTFSTARLGEIPQLYISSGSSADWTYSKANILYSYGVELRDTGEFGFLLPDAQIVPTGLETLAALKALADYVAEK